MNFRQHVYLFILFVIGINFSSCKGAGRLNEFVSSRGSSGATEVLINGEDIGLIFDGLGGISAGASSRLLYDYPEPERGQILDYLFKPNYGASIQILKIEIGSDMNSTDGSEASHRRTPDEINCGRGYEWWLAHEAKKRNPDIKLIGLAWGAPAWVGEFWSDATIDYIISWVDCAVSNGLHIDYLGGWNERGWDADWYIAFDKALAERYPHIQIIGADDVHHPWSIAEEMTKNEALRNAVDIVGDHSPCGWRTPYDNCKSTDAAESLGKPLWCAEHSSMSHDVGAKAMARATNRLYIGGKITSHIVWSLISAWYANFPIGDTGLMLAEWPWSGYYRVGKSIWAFAHTSQFVQPGWQYLDQSCKFLPSGATMVALKSPDEKDYTIVIESVDAKKEETLTFSIVGGLPDTKKLQLWVTNFDSDLPEDQFAHIGAITPKDGFFSVIVKPGCVYTISTTTGQIKGTDLPQATVADQMELPFTEDFESYGERKLARFFSDINGGFETAVGGAGGTGFSYRQVVTEKPISWWHGNMRPATLMGDPRWWGDYEVSADVLLEESGYLEILGRVSAQAGMGIVGLHLQINEQGEWKLYSEDFDKESQVMLSGEGKFDRSKMTLDSGKVVFAINEWHRLALKMKGKQIDIMIDGQQVASVEDDYHASGQIGLLASNWVRARFDNVIVKRTAEWPKLLPQEKMSVQATSDHPIFERGYDYVAKNAIDGRPETAWHSEWQPRKKLPQSLTLDLGGQYSVKGLVYQPRVNTTVKGVITGYNVQVSENGNNFRKVTEGTWSLSSTTKMIKWTDNKPIRYVKFEATESGGNLSAAVGEINIIIE
jgi:O-glycosyl hydrolase